MGDWREALRTYVPRDWVFPIVLSCFVAVVVWFGHAIHEFLLPAVDTVTVPSFVGQPLVDANGEVERLKLNSQVIDHATSDRYPKDVVIEQRPDPGTEVREGRQMSFVISDGVVTRLMPDLRYQSMREVSMDVQRARLQIGHISYAKNGVVPEDDVISQDPAPLVNVHEGDTVNLLVSKGGGAVNFVVPNFVGMKVDDARSMAAQNGIKIGQLVWTPLGSSGPAHGIVARQSVAPGTKLGSYQPISLQVSAGPHESGYILRQVHVLASIPESEGVRAGDSLTMRLTVHDATGTYDAYRAFAQPGQKFDFVVTVLGTSVVDLYVNDKLAGETRLGDEPPAVYNDKPQPSPSPGGN